MGNVLFELGSERVDVLFSYSCCCCDCCSVLLFSSRHTLSQRRTFPRNRVTHGLKCFFFFPESGSSSSLANGNRIPGEGGGLHSGVHVLHVQHDHEEEVCITNGLSPVHDALWHPRVAHALGLSHSRVHRHFCAELLQPVWIQRWNWSGHVIRV